MALGSVPNGFGSASGTPLRLFMGFLTWSLRAKRDKSSLDRRGAPRLAMTEHLGTPPLKSEHQRVPVSRADLAFMGSDRAIRGKSRRARSIYSFSLIG